MKKLVYVLIGLSAIVFSSCEEKSSNNINNDSSAPCDYQINGAITNEAASCGLKCTLLKGVDTATANLSELNGYFLDGSVKLYLPGEAERLITSLKSTSLGEQAYNLLLKDIYEDLILSLNRSAEDAASSTLEFFENAILNIALPNAMDILNGSDTAATEYLKLNTYSSLKDLFSVKISASLDKHLVDNKSTNDIWYEFISSYNSITDNELFTSLDVPTISNINLSDYTAERALTGLFLKIANEEALIRENESHRVTNILESVFN